MLLPSTLVGLEKGDGCGCMHWGHLHAFPLMISLHFSLFFHSASSNRGTNHASRHLAQQSSRWVLTPGGKFPCIPPRKCGYPLPKGALWGVGAEYEKQNQYMREAQSDRDGKSQSTVQQLSQQLKNMQEIIDGLFRHSLAFFLTDSHSHARSYARTYAHIFSLSLWC